MFSVRSEKRKQTTSYTIQKINDNIQFWYKNITTPHVLTVSTPWQKYTMKTRNYRSNCGNYAPDAYIKRPMQNNYCSKTNLTKKIQPAICVSPCGQKYLKIHKKYNKVYRRHQCCVAENTTKHSIKISPVLPDNMWKTTDSMNNTR